MIYPRSVTELSYRWSPSAQGAAIFLAFELNKPGSDEVDLLVDQVGGYCAAAMPIYRAVMSYRSCLLL
jgi:hypothetical protein